mgnify:FL=1
MNMKKNLQNIALTTMLSLPMATNAAIIKNKFDQPNKIDLPVITSISDSSLLNNSSFISSCGGLESTPTTFSDSGSSLGICYNSSTNQGAFFGSSSLIDSNAILYNTNYDFKFPEIFDFQGDIGSKNLDDNYALIDPNFNFFGDYFLPFNINNGYQINGFEKQSNRPLSIINTAFTEIDPLNSDPRNSGFYLDITRKENGGTNMIPEPSTLGLSVLGLGVLGFSRRKNK